MKKTDERQTCPSDTQCMSGFIGTILALVISILAWVQKLSYIPSFTKQDCPEFCEFTRTIDKLKEITVRAEAMTKSSPPQNNQNCICIQDQASDDERGNVQVLYGEKDLQQKTDETQTSSAQLQDVTTEAKVSFRLEKETQDVKDVKVGFVQAMVVECVCDETQVSDRSLPQTRRAQQETQPQINRRDVADMSGSYASRKQYKTKADPKRSYLASRQNRTSQEEIAEVYRTLVSDDGYEAEFEEEEEEVNYFDLVCSEQYRPCRQDTSPYYQYQQLRQPQQIRQPSAYTKREPVPTRQPRSPTYPSYKTPYKQAYEHGRDGGSNPIYSYPTQNRPKPTQSLPKPYPLTYSPYLQESRPQKLAPQTQKQYVSPQYYSPQYSSPRSTSSKRERECDPECPTSRHSMRTRTPSTPASTPRKTVPNPVTSGQSQKRSASREEICELDCPGSKQTMKREDEDNIECIPQCPGYVKKHPRDDCIPECPGYARRRRPREYNLDSPPTPDDQNYITEFEEKPPPKEDCIPNCVRYTPREEEQLPLKEFQSKDVQRGKKGAGLTKKGAGQKGGKVGRANQKQTGAYSGSGRVVAMMPNEAIPIDPYAMQEFEAEKPTNKRTPSDSYY